MRKIQQRGSLLYRDHKTLYLFMHAMVQDFQDSDCQVISRYAIQTLHLETVHTC